MSLSSAARPAQGRLAQIRKQSAIDPRAFYLPYKITANDARERVERIYHLNSSITMSKKPEIEDISAALVPFYLQTDVFNVEMDVRLHIDAIKETSVLSRAGRVYRAGYFTNPFKISLPFKQQSLVKSNHDNMQLWNQFPVNFEKSDLIRGLDANRENLNMNALDGCTMQVLSNSGIVQQNVGWNDVDQRVLHHSTENVLRRATDMCNFHLRRCRIAVQNTPKVEQTQYSLVYMPFYFAKLRFSDDLDFQLAINAFDGQLSSSKLQLMPTAKITAGVTSILGGSGAIVASSIDRLQLEQLYEQMSFYEVTAGVSLVSLCYAAVLGSHLANKYIISRLRLSSAQQVDRSKLFRPDNSSIFIDGDTSSKDFQRIAEQVKLVTQQAVQQRDKK
ncbi:hypothetical protein MP228_001967 [Amoeboaphelidium protococcarum]|nr:hypothetical protein MP228_001967 [Amoeboaphelidium protococcarum]